MLSHGSYFLHCDAPETLDIKICAAIQHGRTLGVSVETNPNDPRVDACIDRAVRSLHFLQSSQMELTRLFFPAEGTPPWGQSAPRTERGGASRRVFARLARSACARAQPVRKGARRHAGATITLSGGPNAEQELRTFDDGPEFEALLASPAFASFARRLSAGHIRVANAAQRELTYRLQMLRSRPTRRSR